MQAEPIRAVKKAQQLAGFARDQGVPISTFVVALTDEEAFELLDFLASGGFGTFLNMDELHTDVEACKVRRDPWPVASELQLQGLAVVRAQELLH